MENTGDDERSLEEMLMNGQILEIGEVMIEPEEREMEIPIYVAEDEAIDRRMIPVLVLYTGGLEKQNQHVAEEQANAYLFTHSVKSDEAQKRLRNLSDFLLSKPGKACRIANTFDITTERDRISAFGSYFAEFISGNKYITPAQFLIKAEVALMNLKNGSECNGRPIRKTIRKALSGKDEKVYDSIRQKLPEIARAVATTGFAIEVRDICADAGRTGKNVFEYARGIRMERYLDEIAASAR
ncbi:MAG: hypothetical protein V1734_04670 [Nanoarchaeota archaeon]